jgi:hypothetical protein
MTETFILGVPSEDRAELEKVIGEMGDPVELVEHRYFDASLYADALVNAGVAAAGWDVLKTWIKARAEVRKATRISLNGIEVTAYSVREAEKMIAIIREAIDLNQGDDEGD